MYIIIVYDIEVKRVAKVCKYLRQHLTWVQNSVFEGEVTKAHLERIRAGLRKIISEDKDSVIFYRFTSEKWLDRETMGVDKSPATNLL